MPKSGEFSSGRPGSNRRRPAWEAGILPLNYARTATEEIYDTMTALAIPGGGDSILWSLCRVVVLVGAK